MAAPLKFQTRIAKRARLDLSPLSPQDMYGIAERVRLSVLDRIKAGRNVSDVGALPLTEKYALTKQKKGLEKIRNWVFTGYLMRDIKVKTASSIRAVIGPVSPKNALKVRKNNQRDRQFGMSPNNMRVFRELISNFNWVRKIKA